MRGSTSTRYTPKEGTSSNSFRISMVPWVEFTGFRIHVRIDAIPVTTAA